MNYEKVTKKYFEMLRLSFLSKLDWGSHIVSIAKSTSKKIALIHSIKFLSPNVALCLNNLQCSLVWNTVNMSGLLLVAAT